MSRLAHHAETLKLERLLDVAPGALDLLADVPADTVRQLRERATVAFFADDDVFFKRVVAASRLLPVPVLALVAEKALGALLSARIAGQMEVKRGVGIASRLDPEFLADVCLHLDPGRTRALIRAIPVAQIVIVALALAARDEHVTMGRFVDIITDAAIDAVMGELDDAHLLQTAFFAENKRRLKAIVTRLPETRLVSLIRTAASDADLWPETLGLMQHLSAPLRGRLADLAASLDTAVLDSMVTAIRTHDLWGDALPLLADMSPDAQAKFANLPAVQNVDTLEEALQAAGAFDVWADLLGLVGFMDEAGKARCAGLAERLDGAQLLQVAEAAAAHDRWPAVIDLLQHMAPDPQADMMALLGLVPASTAESLVMALDGAEAWPLLTQVWPRMARGARDRLARAAAARGLTARLPPEP